MADYGAEGVWDSEGVCVDIEELPVTKGLRNFIKSWNGWYDHDDNNETENWKELDLFCEVGELLAKAVKRQLPDWKVIYFNEKRALQKPRLDYQYEIIL